jgi:hypothetical protein
VWPVLHDMRLRSTWNNTTYFDEGRLCRPIVPALDPRHELSVPKPLNLISFALSLLPTSLAFQTRPRPRSLALKDSIYWSWQACAGSEDSLTSEVNARTATPRGIEEDRPVQRDIGQSIDQCDDGC